MADEFDRASSYEQHERDTAAKLHSAKMAALKPADDCKHCGIELEEHRKVWASCIHCATREEQRMRGFAR